MQDTFTADEANRKAIELVRVALEGNALTLPGPKGYVASTAEAGAKDAEYLVRLIKDLSAGIAKLQS